MDFMNKMLEEATGIGRLNNSLYELCKEMDTFVYQLVGMAFKYDMHVESILGDVFVEFLEEKK
jgi:hypothetical protein